MELTTTESKSRCDKCQSDPRFRTVFYKYNPDHIKLTQDYINDHLLLHPRHKNMVVEWNTCCGSFRSYKITLDIS